MSAEQPELNSTSNPTDVQTATNETDTIEKDSSNNFKSESSEKPILNEEETTKENLKSESATAEDEKKTRATKVRFREVAEIVQQDIPEEDANDEAEDPAEDEEFNPEEEGEDQDSEDDDENQDNHELAPLDLPKGLIANLLSQGNLGSKPLHAAVSTNDSEELEKLLAKDGEMHGNVDDLDVFHYTALHVASEHGNIKCCQVLISNGVDLEARTKLHGSTALHYAAFQGHEDAIEILVKAGANIDSTTDDGRTPLYQAAFRGHPHCVEMLLSLGANRKLADTKGKSPVDVADRSDIIELLSAPAAKKARIET